MDTIQNQAADTTPAAANTEKPADQAATEEKK